MITFGRDICGNYATASAREWFLTNGIGGYAGGSICGALTRHYHALLIAALEPPLGRMVTLVKLNEDAVYDGAIYPLYTDSWDDGAVYPRGYKHIETFRLEGTLPIWTFAFSDVQLEKRIWMAYGENTTYVRYTLKRASLPLTINVGALCNYRDHHNGITRADLPDVRVESVAGGVQVQASPTAAGYTVTATRGVIRTELIWSDGYSKAVEIGRGTQTEDHNFMAGQFEITLQEGESVTFAVSTETDFDRAGDASLAALQAREAELLARANLPEAAPFEIRQLVLAADQFVVQRGDGHTVIAGYPWFGDWGRDTMIALSGLTLSTGRPEIAASILRTFARYVDQGMLPNRFPDEGEHPEYNTVDATLWYFEAIRAYFAHTGDRALLADLYPILREIIAWHERGTRYGIRVDPADGLLMSGETGVQLTWMDVKIDDWVVTPRTGKAVEINALWYNALMSMTDFAVNLGHDKDADDFWKKAAQVKQSFARFWNGDYLDDVLDTPDAARDSALRPNQLFAISLHHSPLDVAHRRAVVDVCARALVTSHGLRSLAGDHPDFIGDYNGDRFKRDSAYHQGTVWGWLIGTFVEAHLKVYRDPAKARSYVLPLLQTLHADCVGTLSEIFDGDAPFAGMGAYAQAWSVSEALRAWRITSTA